jgi:very-short-patch-repair endonuclease
VRALFTSPAPAGEVAHSAGEGFDSIELREKFCAIARGHIDHPVTVRLQALTRKRARQLRTTQTDAERLLWFHLRDRRFLGWRFRRQHPIASFYADFASIELGLVIELDGGQHCTDQCMRYDAVRTDILAARGYRVVRYSDRDVLTRTEVVLEALRQEIRREITSRELPSPGMRRPLPAHWER